MCLAREQLANLFVLKMVSFDADLLVLSYALHVFNVRSEWSTGDVISFTAVNTRVDNANAS